MRGIKVIRGGITSPKGFEANGISCGIKSSGPDLALVYSRVPCRAAGLFTSNRVKAAPVLLSRRHLAGGGGVRAIIANSGCANCCTGKKGEKDALAMARVAAKTLGVGTEQVLVASTGKIGKFLEVDKIESSIGRLAAGLSAKKGGSCARAIMTTDTLPKETAVKFTVGGKTITIGGVAKGAGMISPQLATMFAFFTTDADVSRSALRSALKEAVARTFNLITVDGDMSTNDSVFILASSLAGNRRIAEGGAGFGLFRQALSEAASLLAEMIVRDGEGATRLAEVVVKGARTVKEAEKAARRIAGSNLVKCALFGGDPNWGRIAAAVGSAGVDFSPRDLEIRLSGEPVFRRGAPVKAGKKKLIRLVKRDRVEITVDLGRGRSAEKILTCDLSTGYVKINSAY